jgi:hypothetical protein
MGDCYHWNNVNKPFSEFVKSGKCEAGILIELSPDSGKRIQLLIGDMTRDGCIEGDMDINPSLIVKRYRTVWSR